MEFSELKVEMALEKVVVEERVDVYLLISLKDS